MNLKCFTNIVWLFVESLRWILFVASFFSLSHTHIAWKMLIKSIVFLLFSLGLCITIIDAAALLTPAQQKQAENVLMLAEKMSDRQHQKYCERFGEEFLKNPDLPKLIQHNCIEKLVFNSDNKYLPENFPVSISFSFVFYHISTIFHFLNRQSMKIPAKKLSRFILSVLVR